MALFILGIFIGSILGVFLTAIISVNKNDD